MSGSGPLGPLVFQRNEFKTAVVNESLVFAPSKLLLFVIQQKKAIFFLYSTFENVMLNTDGFSFKQLYLDC